MTVPITALPMSAEAAADVLRRLGIDDELGAAYYPR